MYTSAASSRTIFRELGMNNCVTREKAQRYRQAPLCAYHARDLKHFALTQLAGQHALQHCTVAACTPVRQQLTGVCLSSGLPTGQVFTIEKPARVLYSHGVTCSVWSPILKQGLGRGAHSEQSQQRNLMQADLPYRSRCMPHQQLEAHSRRQPLLHLCSI